MQQQRARRYLALRTGVTAAAAGVGSTFARGLLPRSSTDQALITGASAAYWLGSATIGLSAVEAVAELMHRRRQASLENALLVAASAVLAAGGAVAAAIPDTHAQPLPLAAVRSGAWITTGGALATLLVVGSEKLLRGRVRTNLAGNVALAATLGAGVSALRVFQTERRAAALGESLPRALGMTPVRSPKAAITSLATGGAVGLGLVALAGAEFVVAEGTTRTVSRVLGRREDPVTPLVGHMSAGALMGACAGIGLNQLRRRVLHADDVVEPAYPEPPTSEHVTAGPNSAVSFDAIGKEGRRFVLMALTPDEITAVMGEPAIAPVRAVAGYGAATGIVERARVALAELERLGGLSRSLIIVAAPTGVGYVNYSFAEAVEYLTRGDCAILVPQYDLVPSALALGSTEAGQKLQELILVGLRDRIAAMPPGNRPRVVQFGESLGAEVALDVAENGTDRFQRLGLAGGLYLGTPYRTSLWRRWIADPDTMDPAGLLGLVSQAAEIPALPRSVRHVQVVHHDDPINKFSFSAILRAPVWMGPPQQRPPGVPKETVFRPVVTFIISLADLKNGMNSQPGEFVRRGHDYRIELREAIQRTFGLGATPDQAEAIETALRNREREWAARRMVARRFARARSSVLATMGKWGVDPSTLGLDQGTAAELAQGKVGGFALPTGLFDSSRSTD